MTGVQTCALPIYMFEKCYCREPQPTARTPMVAQEPNWSDAYLKKEGYKLSGVIKIESRFTVNPVNMLEMYNDEGTAWMYDFDNDMVLFSGNPDWVDMDTMDYGSVVKERFDRHHEYAAF